MDRDFDNEPPPEFRDKPLDKKPPVFIGERDIVAIVVVILMCGMNLGIKLYFRTRNDHKKLMALEKENLEQQLEYPVDYQVDREKGVLQVTLQRTPDIKSQTLLGSMETVLYQLAEQCPQDVRIREHGGEMNV